MAMTTLEAAYEVLKVLVVEDEAEMRRVICGMLEQLGVASVSQAADGASGFDELLRARPDVALCDIHMQPVDGQGFLKLVRESEIDGVRDLPVIFLSGDNLVDTVRIAQRGGVDGYMVKPMRRDELKKQLDIIITRLAERENRQRP
jgi:two-component system chemotaxis response regulator CheY